MNKLLQVALLGFVAIVAAESEEGSEEPSATCFTPAAATSYQICFDGQSSESGSWYIEEFEEEIESVQATIQKDTDTMWMLIAGFMVFFMQAGFSMLEAGCVAAKNVQNILYKNLMDACLGALGFWAIGYAIAYGNELDGGFIGTSNFFLMNESNEAESYHSFFFQWAFAATAATIVSGSVAERTKLSAYFGYSTVLTVFVYPVVVHWIWDSEGWLSAFNGNAVFQVMDFAGSGVVHMVGGFSGLMGAIAVGPRLGRFEEGGEEKYKPHNVLIAALGVAILWFGWYGFNCGSTLVIHGYGAIASKVAVTTTMAAAGAATTCTVYSKLVYNHFDLMLSLNGVLAGLVSITAPCPVVDPGWAIVIGIIGAFVYIFASAALKKLKIDDPLDAFPIHGACGAFGVIAVGIFGSVENVLWSYGSEISVLPQLGKQVVAVLCVAAWTVVTSGILFFLMKCTMGIRVEEEVETEGLDTSEHAGAAYNTQLLGLAADKPAKEETPAEAQA